MEDSTTNRRPTGADVRDTEAFRSVLFETLPIGVTVLATDGSIIDANRRAEVVLGLSESTITNRTYDDPAWQAVDTDGKPIPSQQLPFARVMATGEPVYEYEHGIQHPHGSERWLSINATPVQTEAGETTAVVASVTDITEQRASEREIRQQNEQLDAFAAIVSHDLRNPLTVAAGYLELAREERDSDRLQVVADALERMEELTDDLLGLARAGEAVGELEAVALPGLVNSCWVTVATGSATLNVQATGTVRADRSRLRQLIENLLRNAVEHGPGNGEDDGDGLTITVGDRPDGFYVEDDGVGIPPEAHGEVFEPGYTTAEAGTGFGLSIVADVASAHGWQVEISESATGGTRVEVTGVTTVAD